MAENSNKNSKFIEMGSRNMHLRHVNPVGDDYVFVFDIDDCLYQNQDLRNHEASHVKTGFLTLTNLSEDDWHNHLSSSTLYAEIFFNTINIHPTDFARKFDMPQIHKFVNPDPELKQLIKSIPFRKFCLTNGNRERAKMILSHLHLEDVFEAVICSDTLETEFIGKPRPEAFEFFMRYAGVKNPNKVYFFDDSKRNVNGAVQVGWNSIHVVDDIKECIKNIIKCIYDN